MPSYKIEIKKLVNCIDSKYDREEKVYTQIIEDLNVLAVINAANGQSVDYSKK